MPAAVTRWARSSGLCELIQVITSSQLSGVLNNPIGSIYIMFLSLLNCIIAVEWCPMVGHLTTRILLLLTPLEYHIDTGGDDIFLDRLFY
jgi:hypothetical protein